MKTAKFAFLLLCLTILITGCNSRNRIKGNGNIRTEVIEIGDYTKLNIQGSDIQVDYSQSANNSFLEVSTDENIFEVYEFVVDENHILRIRPKREYRRRKTIRPTTFTITTRSKEIDTFIMAGKVDLKVGNEINSGELKIQLAGNIDAEFPNKAVAESISIEMSGKAKLTANDIECNYLNGSAAGKATLKLGGISERGQFAIAGSGTVKAYDLIFNNLKCDIAGYGSMDVHVKNNLDVNIAGKGNIRYKGEPTNINKRISGIGSIKQAED